MKKIKYKKYQGLWKRRKSGSRIQRRSDTSFTVMYLAKEKGYEVYAACANTAFQPEQLKTNEENAYKLGAVKYVTIGRDAGIL